MYCGRLQKNANEGLGLGSWVMYLILIYLPFQAGGLNQKYICTSNRFFQGNGGFAVSEGTDGGLAHWNVQNFADGFGELRIGVAAENLNLISVADHQKYLPLTLSVPDPISRQLCSYYSIFMRQKQQPFIETVD